MYSSSDPLTGKTVLGDRPPILVRTSSTWSLEEGRRRREEVEVEVVVVVEEEEDEEEERVMFMKKL